MWWFVKPGRRWNFNYAGLFLALLGILLLPARAQQDGPVERVYVPYEKLQEVFGKERQGVFLPYDEFQRLWKAAQAQPAQSTGAKLPYLITSARFSGKVEEKLARLQVTLTIDVLEDGWVTVPLTFGSVATSSARFTTTPGGGQTPLLQSRNNRYELLVQGKGRWVLELGLVRNLTTRPGLNVLDLRLPDSAISTLELLIPEENLKVDVEPALATTTSQVALSAYEAFQPGAPSPPALDKDAPATGERATKLQAFMGSTRSVKLSWKPESQAAADLAPVVISDQFQHINVAEALLSREIKFTYDIRRRGIDKLTLDIPAGYRVTTVEGDNIRNWNLMGNQLDVALFSKVKDTYELNLRMERFLKEEEIELPLEPVRTRDVLRSTGLIAVTHAKRRSVEVRGANAELVRVDVARLPGKLSGSDGVTAYQFAADTYSATLDIGTVEPRITVNQRWTLGIAKDAETLTGNFNYKVDRAGVFSLEMTLPEPWEVESIGPNTLVDDHELSGTGAGRTLRVTLKREILGDYNLWLKLRRPRDQPDGQVDVTLPAPSKEHLQLYSGQVVVKLSDALRAEVGTTRQLQPIPLAAHAPNPSPPQTDTSGDPLRPAMAFAFRGVDREADETAGLTLTTFLKPPQVSAQSFQLVSIQPGSINQEAIIRYNVLYAPVDTFYLKMPQALAERGVQIEGAEIQEQPRVPAEDVPGAVEESAAASGPKEDWAYYKVVLQSPRTGTYQLSVRWRQTLPLNKEGEKADVEVPPVLAAGKLSDQTGTVAISKSPTLAIGKADATNLIPADASSATDLPYAPHRQKATIAYKFITTPFALKLPVTMEREAEVFTTIANAVIVSQELGRDGTLNARALFLLTTNRADRLPVTLPPGAKVYSFLVNGQEVPIEAPSENERIVRLPTSAGNVTRLVLEVTYGLEGAWATGLPAPTLPAGVPVQKTIWQVWVPHESVVLGYDHDFARENQSSSAERLFLQVRDGHPQHISKFTPQGLQWTFVRQGAAPEISLYLMSKEWFTFLVWIVVLAAGVWLLWQPMYKRFLFLAGVVVLAGVLYAFWPMFVSSFLQEAKWPFAVVLLIWAIHFFFFVLPKNVDRRAQELTPPPTPPRPDPGPDKEKPAKRETTKPAAKKSPRSKAPEKKPAPKTEDGKTGDAKQSGEAGDE